MNKEDGETHGRKEEQSSASQSANEQENITETELVPSHVCLVCIFISVIPAYLPAAVCKFQ